MALPFLKSKTEASWERFATGMNRALHAASVELRGKHQRHLQLGSPVRIGGETADIIRAPIEVRGGRHEYAIAYLEATSIDKTDGRRQGAIAREAADAAMPYAERAPEKPGAVVFRYP